MSKQTFFSGIQPSGNLHIGNYLGAIKQWVQMQSNPDCDLLFCIVDLHAITIPQDAEILRKKNRQVAALYIACGLDPKRVKIFIQSENPDHAYLAWIFSCMVPMGWMERMTQYKDKSKKQGERTSVGLFNYPILMACDFMLYDADLVPVGDDQKQHLELAADIGEKFNNIYGETFKIAKIYNQKETSRIMSLQNPSSKMSKSDIDPSGTINLLDSTDAIEKNVRRAVTDSGKDIIYSPQKPAIANLLAIYSGFSGISISELEKKYKGVNYGDFKNDLAKLLVKELSDIQDKYQKIINKPEYLDRILDEGRDFAISISSKKIALVKEKIGLSRSHS